MVGTQQAVEKNSTRIEALSADLKKKVDSLSLDLNNKVDDLLEAIKDSKNP